MDELDIRINQTLELERKSYLGEKLDPNASRTYSACYINKIHLLEEKDKTWDKLIEEDVSGDRAIHRLIKEWDFNNSLPYPIEKYVMANLALTNGEGTSLFLRLVEKEVIDNNTIKKNLKNLITEDLLLQPDKKWTTPIHEIANQKKLKYLDKKLLNEKTLLYFGQDSDTSRWNDEDEEVVKLFTPLRVYLTIKRREQSNDIIPWENLRISKLLKKRKNKQEGIEWDGTYLDALLESIPTAPLQQGSSWTELEEKKLNLVLQDCGILSSLKQDIGLGELCEFTTLKLKKF